MVSLFAKGPSFRLGHVIVLFVVATLASAAVLQHRDAARSACSQIAALQNPPPVAFAQGAASSQYAYDVSHWSNASSLPAACTVEPVSVQQIQNLISIINSTRTLWAVKGAGHCNNNNMSSTLGVLIDMTNFRDIALSNDKRTVKLGMGLTWDEVYHALDGTGVNVVGGRLGIVGVAGLSLSGGYSWLTNEYGFTIDNTVAYEIVLPTGVFKTVTQTSEPDLFFALQGGVNNFGIVTHITLKTHSQEQIWGGTVAVTGDLEQSIGVTAHYANITRDPKATMAALFASVNGSTQVTFILFYDGPTPPQGLFDPFLALPNAALNVGTRSYLDFSGTASLPVAPTNRATWYSAPILSWPKELIHFITELMVTYSERVAAESSSGTLVTANIEPFLPMAYSFDRGAAYPHSTSMPFNTFNGLFVWDSASDDEVLFRLAVEYHTKIWEKAIELGVSRREAFFPPNYSQSITSVTQIYGPNLPRLRRIKRNVDPYNIISLTGGFKI